jgi:hypothetical protein
MMSRRWAADDDILADVGAALRSLGSTPESVCAAGLRAFAMRGAAGGAALAPISYDSLLDGAQLRDTTAPRTLEFETAVLSVEIAVSHDGLVGQLIPPAEGTVEMITLESEIGTPTDALGCFSLPLPPPGPVRFRCHAAGAQMITDWVRL